MWKQMGKPTKQTLNESFLPRPYSTNKFQARNHKFEAALREFLDQTAQVSCDQKDVGSPWGYSQSVKIFINAHLFYQQKITALAFK